MEAKVQSPIKPWSEWVSNVSMHVCKCFCIYVLHAYSGVSWLKYTLLFKYILESIISQNGDYIYSFLV
jgi:hypothetical protein